MDRNLNELLRWGIENSDATRADPTAQTSRDATRGLNQEVLDSLLGGPTDADLMKEAVAAVKNPEVNLDNKLIAFDNFEQLVENIDNANNIEALGLWDPLISELKNSEPQLRAMAAWCIGTAVQNNVKAQEKVSTQRYELGNGTDQNQLVSLGPIPTLTNMAVNDSDIGARKKAILALSSVIRNYQPALDQVVKDLPASLKPEKTLEATDMDAINDFIQKLREASSQKGTA
jgi:hsp70-interacting protein